MHKLLRWYLVLVLIGLVGACGVIVMGVLLGTNHLFGYLAGLRSAVGLYGASGGTLWHIYGAAVNYLGVGLGLWAVRAS